MGYGGYGFNPAQATYVTQQVQQGTDSGGSHRHRGPRPRTDGQLAAGTQDFAAQGLHRQRGGTQGFGFARRQDTSTHGGGQFESGRGVWGRQGGHEAMRGADRYRAQQTSTQRADDLIGRADTNGDGQITRDELIAAFDALRAAATATTTAAATTTTDATTVADTTATTDAATAADTTSVADTAATTDATTLADLLATVDTSSTEVPVAPTTDDTTASSVV